MCGVGIGGGGGSEEGLQELQILHAEKGLKRRKKKMKIDIVTNVKVGKYGTYILLANDETTKNISVYPSKNMEEQDMFTTEGVYRIYGDLTLNNKGLPCIYCTKWVEAKYEIESCLLKCKVVYNQYGAFTVIGKEIEGEFISVLIPLKGLIGNGDPENVEVLGILTLSKTGKIQLIKCNKYRQ